MQKQTIKPTIRTAIAADAQELLDIYAPYVTDTAISFEYDVPSLEEFEMRISNILEKYPYLIAEYGGEILGYAYTHAFVGRAAYDHAVETTIYLKEGRTKMGIGRMLYEALERISGAQNIFNMNACIGYPEVPDEHLTLNSVQFHEHMGYQMVGTFHNCGYKFDTWYHMVWMEKIIGNHDPAPLPVIPFPDLNSEKVAHLLHFST
ncbi:MAG: GNAT family N-acetyltransferase [Lachnospiraceae bacterium]|nr:GNAT family N-acetyltransferase [Lachnospiraceae bacterium]